MLYKWRYKTNSYRQHCSRLTCRQCPNDGDIQTPVQSERHRTLHAFHCGGREKRGGGGGERGRERVDRGREKGKEREIGRDQIYNDK